MENDLSIYVAAKERAKANVLNILLKQIGDPAFDILSFASLLAQDMGDESNPLHSVFNTSVVAKALTYVKAAELVDTFLTTQDMPTTESVIPASEDAIEPEVIKE